MNFHRDTVMVVNSVDQLLDGLRETPLLRPDQFAQLEHQFAPEMPDPLELLKHLVRLGWLTLYQAKKILNGRIGELMLGAYIILDKLGEGGMGKVFKAWQTRLSRVVALKVIRQSLLSNDTVLRRFQREAKAAAQLTHNNIVRLFDADQIGERHYLAMEYVEGMDLAQLVKENGPLPVPSACAFIRQAALGLQHAHEKGLVHRDIKPSNLLVTADARAAAGKTGAGGVLKILDMGLARVTESDPETDDTALTQTGTVVGTPDYMSPEQGKNSSSVDARSDLYALGCTLYFLLAGQPPFPKGSTLEKLLQHQIEPIPSIHDARSSELSKVPPAVEAILLKLLAKRPDDRLQSGQELAVALEPCCTLDSGTRTILPKTIPRPSSDATEETGSPFNFDDLAEATAPKRSSGLGRPIVRPTIEPLAAEDEPPAPKRKTWWIVGVGLATAVLVTVAILVLKNRKSTGDSAASPTESLVKEETKPIRKDVEPFEATLAYLPPETAMLAVLNLAQLQQSPLVRDELLPHLDLDRVRPFLKFDPLTAVERVVVAWSLSGREEPTWFLLVQGNGFLTPEFFDFLQFVEKRETISGTTVPYYESAPKAGATIRYAAVLSHSPATVAVGSDKQSVLNAYLRKAENTPPPKKDVLDPYLSAIIRRNYTSAQALYVGMGHTGTLPNADFAKWMKGVHAFSATVRISTEMDFDLQVVGESHDEILAFKNGIAAVVALKGWLQADTHYAAQFGQLLLNATEAKKAVEGKRPLTVQWKHHYGRRELTKWLRGFFE